MSFRAWIQTRNAAVPAAYVLMALNCMARSKPDLIASSKAITTNAQLQEWMTYYYLHPRPELTVSALHQLSREGLLLKANSRSPIAAFLAQLFVSNRDRARQWVFDLDAGVDDEKMMAALATWMAQTDDTVALLGSLATGSSPTVQDFVGGLLKGERPPNFLEDAVTNPGFLDALWGSFFATGDERYVYRVISALPLLTIKDDAQKLVLGGAARWSLTSNAAQHSRVLEICATRLKVLPDDQRAVLVQVIERAKKEEQ